MDVWFCILQEPPPRGNNRELKDLEKLFHALLLSASGELLPLDKDLSWMSANRKLTTTRTVGWWCLQLINLRLAAFVRRQELEAGPQIDLKAQREDVSRRIL
jgi:hypothetical protein